MKNSNTLFILSVDTGTVSNPGFFDLTIQVEHQGKTKRLNTIYQLSANELQALISNGMHDYTNCVLSNKLQILQNDISLIQYSISVLNSLVNNYRLTDILKLYYLHKEALMFVKHFRQIILKLPVGAEARLHSSLLKRIMDFTGGDAFMDVATLNIAWGQNFRRFLAEQKVSDTKIEIYWGLFEKVYVEVCRNCGVNPIAIMSLIDYNSLLNNDGKRSLSTQNLSFLSETDFGRGKEELTAAGNLLCFSHWTADVDLIDVINMKSENIYKDGIWYRRMRDNRLCHAQIGTEMEMLIKKIDATGRKYLFESPFDDMENECKRLYFKFKWYKKQLKKIMIILNNIDEKPMM